MKKRKILLTTLISFLTIILLICVCFFSYASVYYRADAKVDSFLTSSITIDVKFVEKDAILFTPTNQPIKAGIIFYPGGKVEYTSYAPLLYEFAKSGLACIIGKMPFNLAVFSPNKADSLVKYLPKNIDLYIGGHSLGGVIACNYVENHPSTFKGLFLLGSYSTVNLSKLDLRVVSLYGEFDNVLNMKKYTKSISQNLYPDTFNEYIIYGGNHSGFAYYGPQKGDGEAKITTNEQISVTVKNTIKYLGID